MCSLAHGQNAQIHSSRYIPLEAKGGRTPRVNPSSQLQSRKLDLKLHPFALPALTANVSEGLACASPPNAQDITNSGFSYDDSLLTTDEAATLSIPFVKLSGDVNTAVLVRDYVSSITCIATDNKTILTYGISLRTILTIDNYDAKLDGSYAAIAADATYNHKNMKVNIQVKGLSNPQFYTLITQIAGKDFDVDNYPAFYDATAGMIKLIGDTSTVKTAELLGVVTVLDDMTLTKAPAVTWALTEIMAQKTCADALSGHYDQNATFPRDAITSTYQTILGACDNTTIPNTQQKQEALNYLAGLKAVKQ
jgi:hypothetical protein